METTFAGEEDSKCLRWSMNSLKYFASHSKFALADVKAVFNELKLAPNSACFPTKKVEYSSNCAFVVNLPAIVVNVLKLPNLKEILALQQ